MPNPCWATQERIECSRAKKTLSSPPPLCRRTQGSLLQQFILKGESLSSLICMTSETPGSMKPWLKRLSQRSLTLAIRLHQSQASLSTGRLWRGLGLSQIQQQIAEQQRQRWAAEIVSWARSLPLQRGKATGQASIPKPDQSICCIPKSIT